ncbi:MAG: YlmC/YmxH family sporulation protein [Eubacteriales bacterium]|nr:YlmC/YmxH family sporulation protein [Eubacteriales bacterium]
MQNSNDLRRKIVIDIHTAERLGTVSDIDVDIGSGRINAIILPPSELFGMIFYRKRERVIPWSAVTAVGSEFILVDCSGVLELLS